VKERSITVLEILPVASSDFVSTESRGLRVQWWRREIANVFALQAV